MINRDLFFSNLEKTKLWKVIPVDEIKFILDYYENESNWKDLRLLSYLLATIYHETFGKMKPTREAFWLKNPIKYLKSLIYYPYYGRDYVHTTWKANYQKWSNILEIDLVSNPEKIAEKEIAIKVAFIGMDKGVFTGVSIHRYINKKTCDYYNARRVINGIDKASAVELYAKKIEKCF